jgi:hypothetical protein
MIWPDGNLHWLTSRARYLFDIDNQPSDLIGAAIDITELKQAEEHFIQRMQKWVEIGIASVRSCPTM